MSSSSFTMDTGATLNSSIINLVKTILGAGLLSMPLAFSTDGLVIGIFIILLAGFTSGFGLFLQGYVSRYVPYGNATFFTVCSITYPSLSVIFDFAIAVQCFGVGLSYLVLIGDLMPTIISISFVEDERTFWILISSFIIVPLCFLKNLDSLKYTSILALLAILYMSILVISHFLLGDVPDELKGNITLFPTHFSNIFKTFSIIVFAFTGHQNMFSIINELQVKSIANISTLINFSILLSSSFFIIVGLSGYLTFGDKVNGNIISMYENSISTTFGRFCIVFMVVLSFPLMFHPCRISVNNIYYWITSKINDQVKVVDESTNLLPNDIEPETLPSSKPEIVPLSSRTFNVLTTILLVSSYILSISISSFALVLAVVGATGSTAISFILPGLFGYKLVGSEKTDLTYTDVVLKYSSLLLSIWGILVMIVCLYTTLFLN